MTWKSTEKRKVEELLENSATIHSQRASLERLGKARCLVQVLNLTHCPGEMIAGLLGQEAKDRFHGYHTREVV